MTNITEIGTTKDKRKNLLKGDAGQFKQALESITSSLSNKLSTSDEMKIVKPGEKTNFEKKDGIKKPQKQTRKMKRRQKAKLKKALNYADRKAEQTVTALKKRIENLKKLKNKNIDI